MFSRMLKAMDRLHDKAVIPIRLITVISGLIITISFAIYEGNFWLSFIGSVSCSILCGLSINQLFEALLERAEAKQQARVETTKFRVEEDLKLDAMNDWDERFEAAKKESHER
jgi:hypothetical protein